MFLKEVVDIIVITFTRETSDDENNNNKKKNKDLRVRFRVVRDGHGISGRPKRQRPLGPTSSFSRVERTSKTASISRTKIQRIARSSSCPRTYERRRRREKRSKMPRSSSTRFRCKARSRFWRKSSIIYRRMGRLFSSPRVKGSKRKRWSCPVTYWKECCTGKKRRADEERT